MALSDNKKVQSYVNKTADEVQIIRDAVQRMKDIRALYIAAAVDPTGTQLDGNEALVSTSIDALDTESAKAVWDTILAAKVDSHEGNAL